MIKKIRILCDVDDVVAGMIDGFSAYIKENYKRDLDITTITKFYIAECPNQVKLDAEINLNQALDHYLNTANCYQQYVNPINNAIESVNKILALPNIEFAFATAVHKKAPRSYDSKVRWLREYFPDTPIIACPSGQKHWIHGDYAIDDKYTTCAAWESTGVETFLFGQPWNEAPPGYTSYNWDEIINELTQ